MPSASSRERSSRRWRNGWSSPPIPLRRPCSGRRSSAVSTAGNRMPKVRRKNLPPSLLNHLLDRVQERQISADQLGILADWLAHEPDVPDGKWFKRFPGMTVCGESEWVKTSLVPGQIPNGEEIEG